MGYILLLFGVLSNQSVNDSYIPSPKAQGTFQRKGGQEEEDCQSQWSGRTTEKIVFSLKMTKVLSPGRDS